MQANRRERLLIVVVLVCVGAYLAQMIIISPLITQWTTQQEKIKKLKDKIDNKGVHGPVLTQKINEAKNEWDDWRKTASSADNTVTQTDLINQVNNWAMSTVNMGHTLTVSSLNPRWLPEENGSIKLEVRASLVGDLQALVAFIYYLDNSPLPLKVEEINIMGRDDKGLVQTLSCELRFTRLVLTKDIKASQPRASTFGTK